MTTPAPAATATPLTDRPTRPRRPRRWHRLAIPFGLLVLLYLVTGVAHSVEEPDLGDPGTLSPTGTGRDGSSRLAGLLAERGVTVRRATSSAQARELLAGGKPTTVFVPAPDLVDPRFLVDLTENRHRVVLVRPGLKASMFTGFYPGYPRWATDTVDPDCSAQVARTAGAAAVFRSFYEGAEGETYSCYHGGLVAMSTGSGELIAVGSTDPFRNGRIGETGNAALATGLLSATDQVVWVDVHVREPVPLKAPPLPHYRQPHRSGDEGDSLLSAFPPVLPAGLVLLAALGLLIVLVRARRLGPPVAEPLPVLVPATEIVTGRGRLYRRVSARATAWDAVRTAALRRLAPVVGPVPPGTDAAAFVGRDLDSFIGRLAERSGQPPAEVHAILYPAEPATDDDLTVAVARLDALVDTVTRTTPRSDRHPKELA
ncbi:DUF4350 domain-containing protein [Micromonospora sp. NPDC006766]|uniref:DUF4350 domain-containing protein n=1 Tax=Micromonospora sp. NPDC006766 TaxID=3154778 RepID=UPI0033FCB60B